MKYSMRRIILPLLLTMVLMLSACGKSSSTPAQSMPEEPPVQAEPAEPEAQPPRALSAEELRTFTELCSLFCTRDFHINIYKLS